jgi:hypothetical protein
MEVIYPPSEIKIKIGNKSVFLAGSIGLPDSGGSAINWQQMIIDSFNTEDSITILNPRRLDWDSSWKQDIDNDKFRWQVQWELEGLEKVDLIVLYLQPGTMSPISLLELGLFARDHKMVICYPDGFWRQGNVDVVAQRYYIKQVDNIDDLIKSIKYMI